MLLFAGHFSPGRAKNDLQKKKYHKELKRMDTVRRWMSSPALVVDESMPLPDVRQRLKHQHVRRLPVVNADGQLVGIVTEGDINRVSDSHITDVRDYSLYHRVADL